MGKYNIVAITNCPAGIAHTYMVAEAMENKAKSLGHTIKVETQGAVGVENELTPEDVKNADYVILALGRSITESDRERFNGKKVIEMKVSEALKTIETLFDDLEGQAVVFEGQVTNSSADPKVKLGKQKSKKGSITSHLMSGVSASLPFVIGGGLLVAIANIMVQYGAAYVDMSAGDPSFAWVLENIGYLGFKFMIPIMGAYIAYSISDKPAFAPAFIICYLANDKNLLGTESGAGFLGAIIFGLAIGYFVKYMKQIKVGKTLKPLYNFTIIPFVTMFIFGIITYYFMGPLLAGLMTGALNFLNSIPIEYKYPAAILVGAMLAFDMGGPVNKTAWFFCFSLIEQGVYDWYGIVGVVTLIPPIAAGVATLLQPKLFSKMEQESALSAIIVGSTVATEPAIPFALADPVPVIAANTIAGGITGMIALMLGVQRMAPGLGVFDPLLGLIKPAGSFYLALAIGVALNVFLIITFKKIRIARDAKKANN
ncbi:PTS system IIB component, Fru family /PTS system IIC component, Fru family [Granulicatella balaenopterae]|uniref:PTS system IIB component, Fru family /PTS system IIC component, Fru family n=1 Tax=Granulicatella balaenopterae TaxID=137733 RepID=A0A1H9LN38_9LACT|nr:fructose-specific PTS transporter subunit EIIC [Granulicatella balaenopterae]SER12912.1 PTS system IIB component, Fru family /PTS system IIC component, Fru family [Granulicatella balaenopterae]